MRNLKSILSIFGNTINILLMLPILAFVYIIKILVDTIEGFWKNN
jgi:hypothetical protein